MRSPDDRWCDMQPHLTAVVGVCDEIELTAHCLDHLEAQHVDSIVVVDMLSKDGTRELLRDLRDQGRIALVERNNDPETDSDYLNAGVAVAKHRFDSDWILIQDADEFCLHVSGDLRESIRATEASAIRIDRYNACLCEDLLSAFAGTGPVDVASCDIWVEPLRLSRESMDKNQFIKWSAAQPVPKIMARADSFERVGAGGHAVFTGDGSILPAQEDKDLLMVHVPFLMPARFRRKIERAKVLMSQAKDYFVGAVGWHWRRWVEILDEGRLDEEYRMQMLHPAELDKEKAMGSVATTDAFLKRRSVEFRAKS